MYGVKSVLEIGSRYGESLRWFAKNSAPESRIVSVDLGYCVDTGENSRRWWYNVAGQIAEDHDIHMIEGDSHDFKVVKKVESLGPYDFIFIDGDHSKMGVLRDWENYGHLGKIVAFHDVVAVPEIGELFQELSRNRKTDFFFRQEGYGIGVIYQ